MTEELQQTIGRIRNGDQMAFRKLVEHYQHMAFTLAFRILGNEEDAKDAVQDGFVKVWQNIETYNPANKFSAWIYRIMANTAIDRSRKIRRNNEVALDEASDKFLRMKKHDPNRIMDNLEIARMIKALAGDLPEKQQAVFILRDIQGMESSEVQAILGISEVHVKSNLHHARKAIRKKLSGLFN